MAGLCVSCSRSCLRLRETAQRPGTLDRRLGTDSASLIPNIDSDGRPVRLFPADAPNRRLIDQPVEFTTEAGSFKMPPAW